MIGMLNYLVGYFYHSLNDTESGTLIKENKKH